VTHYKDLVVHVPPCVPKSFSDSSCARAGSAFYYPFNSLKEVFYNQDFSKHTFCDVEEQANCSNQFTFTSVGDHLTYFGIHIGTEHKNSYEP